MNEKRKAIVDKEEKEMNKMKDITFESPFDPKWEIELEQIAEIFKNNKEKRESEEEGVRCNYTPELTSDNIVNLVDIANSQDRLNKLLLDQNYLALLVSIQSRLNKLYKDRDNSTAEVDKEFIDNIAVLKGIRTNATSLYDLAIESRANEDVVAVKDIFIKLGIAYH